MFKARSDEVIDVRPKSERERGLSYAEKFALLFLPKTSNRASNEKYIDNLEHELTMKKVQLDHLKAKARENDEEIVKMQMRPRPSDHASDSDRIAWLENELSFKLLQVRTVAMKVVCLKKDETISKMREEAREKDEKIAKRSRVG